jgi:hypothetical protein
MQTDHIKKRLAKKTNTHHMLQKRFHTVGKSEDLTRSSRKGQVGPGKQHEEVWFGK